MMNGIRQYLHEILYLMGPNKKKIPYFALLFSVASLLDLAGLGLIGPYTALAVDLPMDSASFQWGSGALTLLNSILHTFGPLPPPFSIGVGSYRS